MLTLNVPHEYIGVAIGLVTTARAVSGSVGITVYTVILEHEITANLAGNLGKALLLARLPLNDVPAVVCEVFEASELPCLFYYLPQMCYETVLISGFNRPTLSLLEISPAQFYLSQILSF
jgi:hypothetical protein